MSAAPRLDTARARPAARAAATRRPSLALVPARRTAPVGALRRTPFVVLVVGLLGAGLLGLLALHTALAQDAFELHTLKEDSRTLADREQLLQREVEALRAPEALATRATELGMVPAGPPAFLRLSDGAVLGATDPTAPLGGVTTPSSATAPGEQPAAGAETPAPTPAPAPDLSAETPADTPADTPGQTPAEEPEAAEAPETSGTVEGAEGGR
jgi:hypothetical protein